MLTPSKRPRIGTLSDFGTLPPVVKEKIASRLTPLAAARASVVSQSFNQLVAQAPQWETLLGGSDNRDRFEPSRYTAGARISHAIHGLESRAVLQEMLDHPYPQPLSDLLCSPKLFEAQVLDWEQEETTMGHTDANLAAPKIRQAKYLAKTALDLSGLRLHTLPRCIGHLTQLEKFYLAHCTPLTFLPDTISELINLRELYLHGCTTLSSLPETMDQLTRLSTLYVSDCNALTTLPQAVHKLPNLKKVNTLGCIFLR